MFGKRPLNIAPVDNECGNNDNSGNAPDAISIEDQSTGDYRNLCRYFENAQNIDGDKDFVTSSV